MHSATNLQSYYNHVMMDDGHVIIIIIICFFRNLSIVWKWNLSSKKQKENFCTH